MGYIGSVSPRVEATIAGKSSMKAKQHAVACSAGRGMGYVMFYCILPAGCMQAGRPRYSGCSAI